MPSCVPPLLHFGSLAVAPTATDDMTQAGSSTFPSRAYARQPLPIARTGISGIYKSRPQRGEEREHEI